MPKLVMTFPLFNCTMCLISGKIQMETQPQEWATRSLVRIFLVNSLKRSSLVLTQDYSTADSVWISHGIKPTQLIS
ncbi:hypothetical protein D3C81_1188470 [compost metagenome]